MAAWPPRAIADSDAGFDRIRALEAEFLPAGSEEKYEGTLGHMPVTQG